MTIYRLIKFLRLFLVFGILIIAGSFLIIQETTHLILQDIRFHRLYGTAWAQVYGKYEEPLSQTNFKIGLGISYVVVMSAFAWWAYRRFVLRSRHHRRRRHST